MSAIADSCALVLLLRDPIARRRMPNALTYMRSKEVYVPPMVVWEVSRKMAVGKLPRPSAALPELLRRHGLAFLPMTWEVAELAETLPPIHRDPVDRIIAAHSLRQGMPIPTSEGTISAYGVTTIW